jgi:hypothetical protein
MQDETQIPLEEQLRTAGISREAFDGFLGKLRTKLTNVTVIDFPKVPVSNRGIKVDVELYAEIKQQSHGWGYGMESLGSDIGRAVGTETKFLYALYTHLPRYLCTFDRGCKALLYVTIKPNT